MAWYKNGVITLTNGSAKVTASGTEFNTHIVPGFGLVINNSEVYEVLTVDSNTELTLAEPYDGETKTDIETWAIYQTQGIIPDLVKAVNDLTSDYGTVKAEFHAIKDAPMQALQSKADAEVAAQTATKGATSALAAKEAAEAAAEDAIAIVGIDGSVTPGPHKIPIADDDGTLHRWINQTIFIKDPLRQSVEAASGGSYTVIYTPKGQPSFMFRQSAFNLEDIDPSGQLGEGLHPAFIFNGTPDREIFVGAYPAAEVNGEIVCQPGRDLRAIINFDNARAACQALGPGWDMMSNWDWAAIALWCAANGFSPRGNTNYGRSHSHRFETATRVADLAPGVAESSLGRTLTGSGPAAWTHDGTGNGIHDLAGNVWEWVTGLLLEENIFKIAPDNGMYAESEYIDTLVEAAGNGTFSTRPYDDPPLILKQAMAVPTAGLTHDGYFWKNETGQRFPGRGGNWNSAGNAGLDALNLGYTRASTSASIGLRPRFRNQ